MLSDANQKKGREKKNPHDDEREGSCKQEEGLCLEV